MTPVPAHEAGPGDAPGASLFELLDLEQVELNMYRANFVFTEPHALYGGQVAAQALRAASLTVNASRPPHSLHGYFLRPGDASRPTVFQVYRDRDGLSFSARRVVAVQRGEVIFNMSASFQVAATGPDQQQFPMPPVPSPLECEAFVVPRLFSHEGRLPPQPYPEAEYPARFWARCALASEDRFISACALTYLSDLSTGLGRFATEQHSPSSSLDHAVWFHRAFDAGGWLLTDLLPHTVGAGRGWYTGSMFDESGLLVASLAQETLFRGRRRDLGAATAPPS